MVQMTRLLQGEVVQRLAILLGGWVAERMRYGTEGVSNGSGSDIAKATALAVDAVKERGFGKPCFSRAAHSHTGDVLHSGLDECDEVVRSWRMRPVSRGELILERERILHTALVDALCEQGSLNAEQMEALVAAHGSVALRGIGRRPTTTKAKKVRAPKRRHVLRRP